MDIVNPFDNKLENNKRMPPVFRDALIDSVGGMAVASRCIAHPLLGRCGGGVRGRRASGALQMRPDAPPVVWAHVPHAHLVVGGKLQRDGGCRRHRSGAAGHLRHEGWRLADAAGDLSSAPALLGQVDGEFHGRNSSARNLNWQHSLP